MRFMIFIRPLVLLNVLPIFNDSVDFTFPLLPLSEVVDMKYLLTIPFVRHLNFIVHLSSAFDNVVWTLPLGYELLRAAR